jgi:hypothetical protein
MGTGGEGEGCYVVGFGDGIVNWGTSSRLCNREVREYEIADFRTRYDQIAYMSPTIRVEMYARTRSPDTLGKTFSSFIKLAFTACSSRGANAVNYSKV